MDFGSFSTNRRRRRTTRGRNRRRFRSRQVSLTSTTTTTLEAEARRFLEEGDKVKATVQFRGREMSKPELGLSLMRRLSADIGEQGIQEGSAEMAGNRMHLIFGPNKKPVASKKPASA
jgi:translation initiation factor IF-3